MSTIPTGVARRIDRASRHAHAFHRFAHHPLCAGYAHEVISIGRHTVICRGCAYATFGLVAGLVAGLATAPSASIVLLVAAIGGSLAGASFALPGLRLSKLFTRLVPGGCAGASAAGALFLAAPAGVPLAFLLLAGGALSIAVYRRRGPNRLACTTCPERLAPAPCSGLRPIVRRERAFQRLADRWITSATREARQSRATKVADVAMPVTIETRLQRSRAATFPGRR